MAAVTPPCASWQRACTQRGVVGLVSRGPGCTQRHGPKAAECRLGALEQEKGQGLLPSTPPLLWTHVGDGPSSRQVPSVMPTRPEHGTCIVLRWDALSVRSGPRALPAVPSTCHQSRTQAPAALSPQAETPVRSLGQSCQPHPQPPPWGAIKCGGTWCLSQRLAANTGT